MPGFVESTVNAGYGYVDPYIQKTRDKVPLLDRAAQRIEYHAPALISKVDQLAEPTIQKVKPRVQHIHNTGKEKAGKLKGHVDKAKEVLTTGHGHVSQDLKKIVRGKGKKRIENLKTVSILNEGVTGLVTKLELLIDKYMPANPPDVEPQSNDMTGRSSGTSGLLDRVAALPFTVKDRLVCMAMRCIPAKEDLPFVRSYYKLKAKVDPVHRACKAYVDEKLHYLSATCSFKTYIAAICKFAGWANAGCERVLGKQRAQAILAMSEQYMPASWKAVLSELTQEPQVKEMKEVEMKEMKEK